MHLQTTEARTILDVGFGNAQVLKKALRLHSGTYYGVEISETMIKKARQDKALQGMELVYGKVEELPFQDEMFAYQYSINTIYFWESLDQGFQELYRCGKPDSICVIEMCIRDSLLHSYHKN